MKEVVLSETMLQQLQEIYEKLEQDYAAVAHKLHFTCVDCPDNCCDSYFLHHTYAEWAYLWFGFKKLDSAKQKKLLQKSQDYMRQCRVAESEGKRPQSMCPLNEEGLCTLYKHRMLVCRTHGVPASMTRPDGQSMRFPGCFRCQGIVKTHYDNIQPPTVERTPLLRRLVLLESELLDNKRHLMPRVKMTIAEMLVKGPPSLPVSNYKGNPCV